MRGQWMRKPVTQHQGVGHVNSELGKWLNGAEASALWHTMGEKIGQAIVGGIKATFQGDSTPTDIADSIIGGLLNMVKGLVKGLMMIGAEIGLQIGKAMWETITGREILESSMLAMRATMDRLIDFVLSPDQWGAAIDRLLTQLFGPIPQRAGAPLARRASGGPAFAGQPYMVGESGPEPFVPATNGWIFPSLGAMQAAPAFASSNRTTTIYINGNDSARIERVVRRALAREVRR